ncbi:hypothetical protein COU58_02685 [Candidatus Pacearchaeota archaeon CG10_big_fil_rev_8_21_14_0_10_32_42]|nr:MAG: hypothetical protein COU58_02685 [Candidatus Pacearchaeota archaeon CG10_big_fil_rev_8_21_14_0_10_32_42]
MKASPSQERAVIVHVYYNVSTSSGCHEHFVRWGENLSRIANKYGISLRQILRLNYWIKNPNLIHPGWRIRLR